MNFDRIFFMVILPWTTYAIAAFLVFLIVIGFLARFNICYFHICDIYLYFQSVFQMLGGCK
jgi:hypothetical protein